MLDNARDLSNMDPILAMGRVNTLYPAQRIPSETNTIKKHRDE